MSIAEELRQRTFRYALGTIAFCRKLPDTWKAGKSPVSSFEPACARRRTIGLHVAADLGQSSSQN